MTVSAARRRLGRDCRQATEITSERIRYASCKLPDDETFVILLELDDDENNPLFSVPAFRDFQASLQNWVAGPPAVEQLTPVGSYRLF